MADITRAELGLGLFLGYLVTPRGRIIGEIRVPEPKVSIRSLELGEPVIAIDVQETNNVAYQEICSIVVPEGRTVSLEVVSIYASKEPDYAVFKIEAGNTVVEGITLATNLVLTFPFRGRVEFTTGQKIALYVKTSDALKTVKGHGSINGVII